MAMEVNISNHSDGTMAGVTEDYQLKVRAENQSLQHYISLNNGNAYQVEGTATVANATTTVLHIKNDDPDNDLVITYIRLQVIDPAGGTAPPAAANYWEMGFDRTVSSGGSAATPTNMNRKVGKVAAVTCTDSGPTMTGTHVNADTQYVSGESMVSYSKDGSPILGLNDTFEIRLTSDNTSGTAYARVTFLMRKRVD